MLLVLSFRTVRKKENPRRTCQRISIIEFLQWAPFKKRALNPFCLHHLLILSKVSLCSSTWNRTLYMADINPKYIILLPQFSKGLDCMQTPIHLTFSYHILYLDFLPLCSISAWAQPCQGFKTLDSWENSTPFSLSSSVNVDSMCKICPSKLSTLKLSAWRWLSCKDCS